MANQNTPTLPSNSGKPIGASGTYISGGIITLEEYNYNLIGRNALHIYDIMRRSDSGIRAIMQVVKLPLLSAKWDMHAPVIDKTLPNAQTIQDQADYKARYIKRELMGRNVNFSNLLKDLLSGLEFGFDVEEKTLELTDFEGQTRIGIKSIEKRKQTTILNWDGGDGQLGITQILPDKTVKIPMEKLIVFTHDKEGDNYEGISMLRYVYKDWDIKDKLTIVNAIALEKMAVGVPKSVPRQGMTPSTTDLDKIEDVLRNFRANEQGFLQETETVAIEMLDMKANSNKEVIPTLNYHDARVSKSILAGFLEIGGHSGSGSQALAKDLTSLFMKSEEALANLVISTLQEQLIKQLCDFNFTDMSEGYPQLVVSNLADDDVTGLATSTAALVTAGAMTPDATLEDHLREILGMPTLPDDMKEDYQSFKQTPAPSQPTEPPVSKKDQKDLTDQEKASRELEALKASRRRLIEVHYEGK